MPLTEYLAGVLDVLTDNGLWPRRSHRIPHRLPLFYYERYANGTGCALSIDGSTASGVIKEAMVYANVIRWIWDQNYPNW
ncbi:hypothetical protein ACLK1T_14015 [Escherichia coli]